jgi:DNA ligase-1
MQGTRAKLLIYDDYIGDEIRMQIVYDICRELQNTTSTIEKQNLLKRYENNELFKEVLKFLLDPMIVTGVSKKKINKSVNISIYEVKGGDYKLKELLNYIKTHNTGTDNDIAYVQFYISHLTKDEELQNFIKSIIIK